MRKKIVPFLAAALVLGAGIARWGCRRPFRYAGTLEVTEVGLSPRVAGPIREVAVREGDAVKKDQIVVRLDGDDLRLAADLADRDFRRGVTLNKNGSLPDEALDRLRFKRDDTALRLSWCDLRSPLDGLVLHRHREPGEWVAPAQNLLTLADAAHPYAYFYVAAPVMARLSVGQKVAATLPELGDRSANGVIVFVRGEAEFTPKNVQTRTERERLVFGVKVAFDNADGALKPGMTVETAF